MKTSKPLRVGVLIRPYELARKVHAVVTLFAPFRLDDPKHLLTDMEMWLQVGECLGEQGILDEGLAKVSGEVLVGGKCHPPKAPQKVSFVRVAVHGADDKAKVDKRIAVFGDREWKNGVPTEPAPFDEMPIAWSRAFGGEKFKQNTKGRGAAPTGEGAAKVHALPNLEDPARLIRSPSDEPRPMTFLPFDPTSPQRMEKQGKNYGDKWLKERFPGPADDLDPTFYHQGDEDQRWPGYFEGGERFVIENMHPEHSRIEGVLPKLVGRAFICRRPADAKMPRRGRVKPTALEEVKTRLETLWFFPEAMLGVLVFRGAVPALEEDLSDIEQLMVGLDDPAAVRPMSHWVAALDARHDEEDGAIRTLDDDDLLPSADLGWKVSFPEFELEAKLRPEGHLRDNQKRSVETERAKARAVLEEKGLDPATYGLDEPLEGPELPSHREPKKLAAAVKEQLKRGQDEKVKLEAEAVEMEARAREKAKEHGLDWDEMKKAAIREVGPPKLMVRASFEDASSRLEKEEERGLTMPELRAFVDDDALIAKLERLEKEHVEKYRIMAQYDPEVRFPADEIRTARRGQAELAKAEGLSLAGVDLSGSDLSGLDLSGMDLTGAFLEGTTLVGTALRGAKLDKAVLAHSDLTDADLSGASLVETNLGATKLVRTKLVRTNAKGAYFDRAALEEASLSGSCIEGASFVETTMVRPDFSNVTGHQTVFIRNDLTGVNLAGAKLTKTMFLETKLDGASFEGADMPGTQLLGVSAVGLNAKGAKLTSSFIGHGSSLDQADFDGADLTRSSLRTTSLIGATFREATLKETDLSECDATGACFERAHAQKALLMRTILRGAKARGMNLMEALMSRADLAECDLSGTNMFRADLSRVHVSGGTKIDGSYMDFARAEPKERTDT
jgi:uncharacterized protein YjbI with pentapeptide repeats